MSEYREQLENKNVSMTIRFPKDIYWSLKKLAVKDRRSMKQQILFLIEKAAKDTDIEETEEDRYDS